MTIAPADVRTPEEAAQRLEAVLLRQLIASSGVFKGGGLAGGHLRADMFVEALADAVAKGGGLGIAGLLERSLGPRDGADGPAEQPGVGGLRASPVRPGLPGAGEGAARVTSGFGPRLDPLEGERRYHTGVDLAVPSGTPVKAVLDGVVKSAGSRGGYGEAVEIQHPDGLSTLYAHNAQLLVRPGETVRAGQPVALSGQSGRATGPHVHFEVRRDDRPVDPQRALNAYGVRAEHTVAGRPRVPPKEGGTP